MQRRSDDHLVAYLDGEVKAEEQREIEAWLATDPAARERLAALSESANLLRLAYDEVFHEPVPDRLIAAARGETALAEPSAQVLPFKVGQVASRETATRPWWMGMPVAASVFGLLLGGIVAYFGVAKLEPGGTAGKQPGVEMAAADDVWLENAAGYFKLFVAEIRARRCKKSARACRRRYACRTSSHGVSISEERASSSPMAARRRSWCIRPTIRLSGR